MKMSQITRSVGGLILGLSLLVSGPAWAQSEAGLGMPASQLTGSGRVVHEAVWASWLVEALGLDGIFSEAPEPAELFGLLCADRGQSDDQGLLRRVQDAAPGAGGRMRFSIQVPATALYQLAVRGRGRMRWTVDGHPIDHIQPGSFGLAIAPKLLPLRVGAHELAVYTGSRSRVDRVELAVFRPACIAPVDGWHADRPLTHAAAARTLVRAMGLSPLLPVAGDPIEVAGAAHVAHASEGEMREGARPSGAEGPAEFEYRVTILEPGVHSVIATVLGAGEQVWSVDARYRSRVQLKGEGAHDVHVMSVPLASGDHVIRVLVPHQGRLQQFRLVRQRSSGVDALALIDRLGMPTRAPVAQVTRAEAFAYIDSPVFVDRAMRFLRRESLRGPAEPLVLADLEGERAYDRPLSPVLPGDL